MRRLILVLFVALIISCESAPQPPPENRLELKTPAPYAADLPRPTATATLAPTSTSTPAPTDTPKPTATATPPAKPTETPTPLPTKPSVLSDKEWMGLTPEQQKRAVFVDKWFNDLPRNKVIIGLVGFTDEEIDKLHHYSVLYMSVIKASHPEFQEKYPQVKLPIPLDNLTDYLPIYMRYIKNNTGKGTFNHNLFAYGMLLDLNLFKDLKSPDDVRYLDNVATIMKEMYSNMLDAKRLVNKETANYLDRVAHAALIVTFDDQQFGGEQHKKALAEIHRSGIYKILLNVFLSAPDYEPRKIK